MSRARSGFDPTATPPSLEEKEPLFAPPAFLPDNLKKEINDLHAKLETEIAPLKKVKQEIDHSSSKPSSTEDLLNLPELMKERNKLNKELEKPQQELKALNTLTESLNALGENPSKEKIDLCILTFKNSVRGSDFRSLFHDTTMAPSGMFGLSQSNLDKLVDRISAYNPPEQQTAPTMKPR